jgi:hypothetical protein
VVAGPFQGWESNISLMTINNDTVAGYPEQGGSLMFFDGWQNIVIAVVQWIFVAALVPTIYHPTDKPAFPTAVVTAVSLFAMAFAMANLKENLGLSVLSVAAGGIAWTIVAYQRCTINKRTGQPLFVWPKSTIWSNGK